MSTDVQHLIKNLCSSKALEHDACLAELHHFLQTADNNSRIEVESCLLKSLTQPNTPWESTLGCFLGIKIILNFVNVEFQPEFEFATKMLCISQERLKYTNVEKIQCAAGEILGILCKKLGPSVFEDCKILVIELIKNNSEIQKVTTERAENQTGQMQSNSKLLGLKTLHAIVEGCGEKFIPYIDKEMIDIISETLTCKNADVKEAAFYITSAIAASCKEADYEEKIVNLGRCLLIQLADGLADDSSSIRLSACVAVRRLLQALPNDDGRQLFYPKLLPRMCLNRYYGVDNVRIYSQETWRQTVGCNGQELVEQHMESVVLFYAESVRSSNHIVREAACACLTELATKLQPRYVRPHVQKLLRLLLVCFSDNSWPVRDAACLACGSFVFSFPKESEPFLPELYLCFFRNLGDAIPSVRNGAASALTNIVKVHTNSAIPVVLKRISEGFEGLSKQPHDSVDAKTTNKKNVCGTSTPKLGRANSTDHRFHRSSQPWEFADGCVILLAELSSLQNLSPTLIPTLPLLATACTKRHFESHLTFLETVCKHLPTIARGLGKKNFKLHLDDFLEPIFYSLDSESSHTSSAASQCLNQLSTFLGPNVLRARVQAHSPSHLRHLDANLYIAPF